MNRRLDGELDDASMETIAATLAAALITRGEGWPILHGQLAETRAIETFLNIRYLLKEQFNFERNSTAEEKKRWRQQRLKFETEEHSSPL